MEKTKKKAGLIVIISLVGVLAVMGIVFATLSQNLNFTTSNFEYKRFRPIFDLTGATSSVNSERGDPGTLALDYYKQELTIRNIRAYRDETSLTYNLLMKNDGAIPCKLTQIILSRNAVTNVTIYLQAWVGSAGDSVPTNANTQVINSCSETGSSTTLPSSIILNPGQCVPFKVNILVKYTSTNVTTSRSLDEIRISPHWEAVTS